MHQKNVCFHNRNSDYKSLTFPPRAAKYAPCLYFIVYFVTNPGHAGRKLPSWLRKWLRYFSHVKNGI